jgi:Dynein heavy chain, N-terminal region 2
MIVSMISQANEYVALKNPVKITDDVEVWLGELEKSMRETLNSLL